MSKELDLKIAEILHNHFGGIPGNFCIAEIKAAILEHAVPNRCEPHLSTWDAGYNQAVTEITEKLK